MWHLLYVDIWGPIWPNLAASAISLICGWLMASRKILMEMERREVAHIKRHMELRKLLENKTGPGAG